MTYQVLARKWRPRFFREMVGQEHVLKALINALDSQRLHQAYLFTGTRGVGKTTIARILAKCLNCEKGITSEPCGECSACQEIAQGSFVDLIEIDAASHTGVDNMRSITDNAQYTPSNGRFKVYLIDEVHMLTQHSFNALLKTLEEPPAHTKFLLATTDPQKIPATVLSRCLQFNLKNMVPEYIVKHLQHVLQEEKIPAENAALWALARAAQGSMRDALSLTDQAIAFTQGNISLDDVSAMLGTIGQQTVYQLMSALLEHNAESALQVIAKASELSPDYVAILDALLMLLHRLSIAQLAPSAIDNSEGDQQQVLALAEKVSAAELQLFYQMGLLAKRDIYLAPDMRTGLEMAVLRMLAFRPFDVPEPVQNIAAPPTAAMEQSEKKPEAVIAPITAEKTPQDKQESTLAAVVEVLTAPSVTVDEVIVAPAPVIAEPIEDVPPLFSINEQLWLEACPQIPFVGMLQMIMQECVLEQVHENKLHFLLHPDKSQFFNATHNKEVEKILSAYFKRPLQVSIECVEHTKQTPQQYHLALREQRKKQAIDVLQETEVFRYFNEKYHAELQESTLAENGEYL